MSLVTKSMLMHFKRCASRHEPVYLWRSGRSTLCALKILAACYEEPGKAVAIVDHYGSREADRYLAEMIAEMIERLEWQHFEISWSARTIRLKPLSERGDQ